MDLSTLVELQNEVQVQFPKFEVLYKDEVWWQRLLGRLVQPFNPSYMTTYTTTLGSKVYFPSRAYVESNPSVAFSTLAHEYVHIYDAHKWGAWFGLTYALPQALSVLFAALYLVFGGWHALAIMVGLSLGGVATYSTKTKFEQYFILFLSVVGALVVSTILCHWLTVLFALSLVCLAPWPSVGRSHWEIRGYTMTMAVQYWSAGSITQARRDQVLRQFVGPAYMFMSWSPDGIRDSIARAEKDIVSGDLLADTASPYHYIHLFMQARKLVTQ